MTKAKSILVVGAGDATGGAIARRFALHCQPRTAWTHELVLRPWSEKW